MELPAYIIMSNSLRGPDPVDQFPPSRIVNEATEGTRHPNRFESRTASVPDTSLVRNDAVRVYRNAALNVTTGDIISWDAKTFDTTGIWNGSTKFVIPATGKVTGAWFIYASIGWPGTGAGVNRQVEIRKNGAVITTVSGLATQKTQTIADVVYDPSRGDEFTITVVHDTGGVVGLLVGSNNTFFSMIHTG